MKSQFFPNRVVWRLGLATRLSREFKLRANGLASLGLLSCNATAGMTLQLPCMLHMCANFGGLPITSHSRIQPWVSASLHNLEHFFTLSHSLSLHDSYLNTGLLITKIQANLAWNKANKIVDKNSTLHNSFTSWIQIILHSGYYSFTCINKQRKRPWFFKWIENTMANINKEKGHDFYNIYKFINFE